MALQHEYKDMVLSIGACGSTLLLRSKGFLCARVYRYRARDCKGARRRSGAFEGISMIYDSIR